jgi:hypothetical protein
MWTIPVTTKAPRGVTMDDTDIEILKTESDI